MLQQDSYKYLGQTDVNEFVFTPAPCVREILSTHGGNGEFTEGETRHQETK